ncbi:MAG: AAA family ATPase [Zetaproteobacteria bacterium]|nr:MAG: AAA family ATPase [Zetaproteobacteria bacterium]
MGRPPGGRVGGRGGLGPDRPRPPRGRGGVILPDLAAVGYEADRGTKLAVSAALTQRGGGARALLVTGAPGTGKTALAEAIAASTGADFFYALLHPWSGADDLFCGVDIRAAVAGEADHVRQPGILAQVARASHERELVVVCLDEVDKAPEATEALLLDWLQSGRVPLRPGEHIETRLDRVIVVLTSNGGRRHTDALLRRCRRLRMRPMSQELRLRLAAERSGAPAGVVRLIDRACQLVARAEGNDALSLQEISHACREVWEVAEGADDVVDTLVAWAARTDECAQQARTHPRLRQLAAAIWGEVVRARRPVA